VSLCERLIRVKLRYAILLLPALCLCVSACKESDSFQKNFCPAIYYQIAKANSVEHLNHSLWETAQHQTVSTGYSGNPIWIFIPLQANLQTTYISLSNPGINQINAYWFRDSICIKSWETGNLFPVSSREFPFNRFAFAIQDTKVGDRFYLRLENQGASLKTRIMCMDSMSFHTFIQQGNFIALFLFGALFFQWLFAIAYSLIHRKKMLYWYAAVITSIWIHQWFNMGYGVLVLPNLLQVFGNTYRLFPASLFAASLTGFAFHLLDMQSQFSNAICTAVKRIRDAHFILATLAFLPIYNTSYTPALVPIFYLLFFTTLFLLVCIAAKSATLGHKPAFYYLVVHIPAGIVMTFQLAINAQLVEYKPGYHYLLPATALFEAWISLFLITYYMNRVKILNVASRQSSRAIQADPNSNPAHSNYTTLFQRLEDYMKQDKPYLNSNLKISDVADSLNVSVHELSKAINRCGKCHFFDYINSFRITYACTLLTSKDHANKYTLEVTAETCGFNTRVTFHAAFKRFTGITPTAFRNQMSN